jgi:hypothetical protein
LGLSKNFVTMNIASSPEAFGLTTVGSLSEAGLSWEFNDLIVWRDASGQMCWATDSGCSCPIPFEDETLETVAWLPETIDEFRESFGAFPASDEEKRELIRAMGADWCREQGIRW